MITVEPVSYKSIFCTRGDSHEFPWISFLSIIFILIIKNVVPKSISDPEEL